jgi:FeS assembly SUF system regulator
LRETSVNSSRQWPSADPQHETASLRSRMPEFGRTRAKVQIEWRNTRLQIPAARQLAIRARIRQNSTELVLFLVAVSIAGKARRERQAIGRATMVRLSKLTDYGMLLMSCFARTQSPSRTARDLAEESGLPLPTVSKILKQLLQSNLLVSQRGINGGYSLSKRPRDISLAEIVTAMEGPIALTACSTDISGACELEVCCSIKRNQQIISQAVRGVLEKLTLADLSHPLKLATVKRIRGNFVPAIGLISGRTQ